MKIGLVLAGGGGKGAYHIGVWKAFKEYGVDQNIIAVSGSSVGALNAALFMEGDYFKAENIWHNITHEKILSPPDQKQIIKILLSMGFTPTGKIIAFFKAISNYGLLSRSGLFEIIQNEVDLGKVSNSSISGFGTCLRMSNRKVEYFPLNEISADRIISILLASSAIPLLFPPETIDGSKYVDGGIGPGSDNLPIQPLYDKGCDTIFVVHLSQDSIIDKDRFSNAQILEIVPQNNPGRTLDFSPSGARRRIEEGYNDTIAILKPVFDMENVQKGLIKSSSKMLEDELKMKKERAVHKMKRQELKNEIHKLIGDNT